MADATRADPRAFHPRIERFHVLSSASWLTERDQAICLDLHEHRVLTSDQLAVLHFTAPRRARRRLLKLHEASVIDRFRPYRYRGSAPWHYVLGELGARVVASALGLDVTVVRQRMARDVDLVRSQRLSHIVEANDFFARLVESCRGSRDHTLTRWWGERTCAAALDGRVHPDGLGRITAFGVSCTFVLELDRGTERGDRLREKILSYASYVRLRSDSEAPDAVLFLFPSAERERRARRKLDIDIGIRVATGYRELFHADPLGRIWLPTDFDRRLALPLVEGVPTR